MYTGIGTRYENQRKVLEKTNEWYVGTLSQTHLILAVTVTFKGSGQKPSPERWSSLYRNKFLFKLNKQITRRGTQQLIYGDDFRYEFLEKSRHKMIGDLRNPHHVHGVICVPHEHSAKIWNAELREVTERLSKDITSIKEISSFVIEACRGISWSPWLRYANKGKLDYFH
jgi:hypothetical protein